MAGGGQWGGAREERGRGGQRGRQEPGQAGRAGPCKELGFKPSAVGRLTKESYTIRFAFQEDSLSCCAGGRAGAELGGPA